MDWDDLKVFLAVASAGSLAGGARRLSVSQAALNRGFEHLGRFAGQYRALFGQAPSHTIRAATRSST